MVNARVLIVPLLVGLVIIPFAEGGTYVTGLTFVVRDAGEAGTLVDSGGVVCRASTGSGVGGGCIPWSTLGLGESSVLVTDEVNGTAVAYQACIDNDGNGICGGEPAAFGCDDQIFFSHSDGGSFFNPLGPLPTSFSPGCGGGYPGWVVFLCTGAHNDSSGPHSHPASAGSMSGTTSGTGYGNFCGGGTGGAGAGANVTGKPYLVVP